MNPTESDAGLRDEINKRFTLNWLIQGAAQHAGMTFHHLVREGLEAVHPELVLLYDQYALINLLQYWAEADHVFGSPAKFWRRAKTDPTHPFHGHPVLARHGGMLAAESHRRGRERAKEKGLSDEPGVFKFQAFLLISCLQEREAGHEPALIELAKHAVTTVWGISPDRLEAAITHKVAFGKVTPPRTDVGRAFLAGVVGYGGVLRRGGRMMVVGRGTNWYLMAKELVKGTAELVCLHGLNRLPEDVYRRVVAAADGIDFEPWMLQTGGELWRRFLAVQPGERPIAEMLMHVARLSPGALESLILAVIERPEWARELMAGLDASDEGEAG
ncbi:MAG: hypothetical protein BGO49_24540 [Planctomycetales bacterium 71-10]|nr:MAG: hypothetical protein BGO49_24540 [Planctomycetales bacterium 71-10]